MIDKIPKVVSLLSYGEENAKTARELVALLGYKNDYYVRKEISQLRIGGYWYILSSDKGFFLMSTDAEYERYIRHMRGRARKITKIIEVAEQGRQRMKKGA